MLRDVVVHLHNEQPLRADLLFEPSQTDNVIICRNLRTMNGKKPVFIDEIDSTFMLPLAHIRFVEIPRSSIESHADEATMEATQSGTGNSSSETLERLAWLTDGKGDEPGPDSSMPRPDEVPDELDDDLLRRIRDA